MEEARTTACWVVDAGCSVVAGIGVVTVPTGVVVQLFPAALVASNGDGTTEAGVLVISATDLKAAAGGICESGAVPA